ncbi:MAG: hypothetical protein OEV42_21505 [Deltaproteobacteria bacterium]|nr:hypothetical protein [Deltaproteobacteria bacterium]
MDRVVENYWNEMHAYYLREDYQVLFSPETYKEDFEESKINKRGLSGGAQSLLHDCINEIVCGLVERGLELAVLAKKFSETAIKVGDLMQYMNPPYPKELGLYLNYEYLQKANWILTGKTDKNLRKSLYYLSIVRKKYEPPEKNTSVGNRWVDTWTYVVSYMIGGNLQEAINQFNQIHGDIRIDFENIAKNSENFVKTMCVVLKYLQNNSELEDIARNTFNKFCYNISGWGKKGSRPSDKMWKELTIEEHFQIARIRAIYFTGEKDPVKIIQSIKGLH